MLRPLRPPLLVLHANGYRFNWRAKSQRHGEAGGQPAGDFGISATPSSLTIVRGNSGPTPCLSACKAFRQRQPQGNRCTSRVQQVSTRRRSRFWFLHLKMQASRRSAPAPTELTISGTSGNLVHFDLRNSCLEVGPWKPIPVLTKAHDTVGNEASCIITGWGTP